MSEGDPTEGDGPRGGSGGGGRDEPLEFATLPASAVCPFCGGRETEQFSAFGSQLSTSQYYCRRCRTVFEYMKWHEPEAPGPDGPEGGGSPGPRS